MRNCEKCEAEIIDLGSAEDSELGWEYCPNCNNPRIEEEEDEMTHTPGPWHDSGLPEQYERVIVNEDGRAIAKVNHSAPAVMLRASIVEEAKANARLIAAAPALLEALENATRYLEHPDVQAIPFALPASNPLRAARNAIALAKGQVTT